MKLAVKLALGLMVATALVFSIFGWQLRNAQLRGAEQLTNASAERIGDIIRRGAHFPERWSRSRQPVEAPAGSGPAGGPPEAAAPRTPCADAAAAPAALSRHNTKGHSTEEGKRDRKNRRRPPPPILLSLSLFHAPLLTLGPHRSRITPSSVAASNRTGKK